MPQQDPQRPDPNTLYAVPVDDSDAFKGSRHAKVTIVEAFEFACPHCSTVGKLLDDVLKEYKGDQVKVVSKHFIVHPQLATHAALATCAANRQGKFAAWERRLWPLVWQGDPRPQLVRENLEPAALEKLAGELGLDLRRFKADMTGADCAKDIEKDRSELAALGIRGTPGVYINGRFYMGQRTVEAMKQVIDAELAKADKAIAAGTPAEAYYQSAVVDKGLKSL